MAISAQCPHCGELLAVKDEFAGRKGLCPKCREPFRVPDKPEPRHQAVPVKAAAAVLAADEDAVGAASATHLLAQVPTDPLKLREAILGGFDSRMLPPAVPLARKLSTLFVLAVLLVLPLFYVVALAALSYGLFWLATSSYGRALQPAVYWTGLVVGSLLLVSLLKPLLEPRRRRLAVHELAADKAALLSEFIERVCQQIDAAPPQQLQLECSTRLAAERNGGVLTIGLPLAASLSVEQLGGLIAGQMALYRRGAACRPTNLIRAINGWLWRSIYEDSRFDAWLARVASRPGFSAAKLLVPLRAAKLIAQAVLFVPMFIGNTLAQGLVRQSELDADRAAARLVGRETFAATLVRQGVVDFTWEGVLAELEFLNKEQALPDSLPQQLALRMLDMTPELCAALRDTVVKQEEKPFDSRPSDEERLAATNSEPVGGVLVSGLPARALFDDYEGMARKLTWDYYVATLGSNLVRTGLAKVKLPAR